jgi:hypothetical protein
MNVRGGEINGALILRIRVDISSYPYESFVFKDFIILLISFIEVGSK